MIKVKFGNCPECNDEKDKAIVAGVCLYHYKKKRAEISITRSREKLKNSKIVENDLTKPTKLYLKNKDVPVLYEDVQNWFKHFMAKSNKRCENCGASLKNYNDKDWYGSQHHILEKSLFPTLAANLENHMVLGKRCCHSQWHTSWQNAEKMKCFPVAKQRVSKIINNLTKNEFRRLPECFKN